MSHSSTDPSTHAQAVAAAEEWLALLPRVLELERHVAAWADGRTELATLAATVRMYGALDLDALRADTPRRRMEDRAAELRRLDEAARREIADAEASLVRVRGANKRTETEARIARLRSEIEARAIEQHELYMALHAETP